jgi:AbrB family looped-hinge helix DNA binding protein
MLMKVHRKGQVVIPAEVRKQLGIDVGDVLEVEIVPEEGKIELRRPSRGRAASLAGSLRRYAQEKTFPSDAQISDAMDRGLARDG